MTQPAPAQYKTTNWRDYNAALKARGSLLIWLDPAMQWYAPACGKPGRQHTFSDAAIQFCLSIKVLFGLALRQAIGLVESLIKLAGLHLLIDSTGIQRVGRNKQRALRRMNSGSALS